MPPIAACPDLARYQQLATGKLAPADEETLLAHLEHCEACSEKLKTLGEPDALVSLLRQARRSQDAGAGGAVARLVERLSKLRPGETSVAKDDETVAPRESGPAPRLTAPCPACGKTLKVSQELAGKRVKCPHCKQTLRLPGAAAADASQPRATVSYKPAGDRELYDFLAPPQAADELGRLGPYRVLRVLGAGGMGVVFRAEDPHLARLVALKAMLPGLAASESARQRFLREARAAAAIKHDHIVTIYQVGEDRGVPFLAMEFLEGESLDARLEREGKLPVAEVVRIGREIALGLAAAHKRTLIHRDIKPANLWLEAETGRVKILDFGLARAAGEGAQLTQQGAIIGTPAYMAPEQAQGKTLDGRCDLFSLGCVLYRLATGQPAFRGTDIISTVMAVATEEPPAPRQLDAAVPPALSDLIMALLAKEPGNRPPSAHAVVESLECVVCEREPRSAQGATVSPPPAAKPGGRKRWRIGAAVAAGVLVTGLLLWAAGVIKIRTMDGTIVLDNLDPDAEVLVDGDRAVVTWGDGDKKAEVRVKPGTHEVEVKKGGLAVAGTKLTVKEGGRQLFTVRGPAGEPGAEAKAPASPPVGPEAERRAAQWVLSLGGSVTVQVKAGEVKIAAGQKLPTQPFQLRAIDLWGKGPGNNPDLELPFKAGDGLAHLEGLTSLVHLDLHGAPVTDAGLAHLKGLTNLRELLLWWCPEVTDDGVAHLKDLTGLRWLDLNSTHVTDAGLESLKGYTNLTRLNLMTTEVTGAGFVHLKGLTRLEILELSDSPVEDAGLAHLRGLSNLRDLYLGGTRVTDAGLSHLKGLTKLRLLDLTGQPITGAGLVSLRGLADLRDLSLKDTKVTSEDIAALKKALPECHIAATPPAARGSPLAGLSHVAWLARVKALPAGNLLDAVSDRLRELNPGFDGKMEKTVEDGQVVSLGFGIDSIKDISPVQALPGLRKLECIGSWERKGKLADLTPLKGMKLTELTCVHNQVADLSTLQGMPLRVLNCSATRMTDLSVLKGMNLMDLDCSYLPITDLSPLKGMKLRRLSCWHAPVTDAGLIVLEEMSGLHDLSIGGIKMTDAGFVHLNKLTELEFLACSMMKLNGDGLVHVTGMARLKYLWLAETQVTDEALVHIQGLPSLRELRLQRTRVTDAGLEHLAGLKNLVSLNVTGTAVTDKGVAKLKAALPRCNIIR